MAKATQQNGVLAAGSADDTAEANSMEDGSGDAYDLPSLADINGELGIDDEPGLSPAGDDEDPDEEDLSDLSQPSDDSEPEEDEDEEAGEDDVDDEEAAEPEEVEEAPSASPDLKAMQDRLDAMTRKNAELEERYQELQARTSAAEGSEPKPTSFDAIDSIEALQEMRGTLIANKQFLLKNLDGFTQTIKGEEREFSAEDARGLLADVEQKLDVDLPSRAEYLKAKQPMEELAKQAYPSLFKSGTGLNQFYLNALKRLPGLRGLPDQHLIAGDAAIGAAVRSGQLKLAGAPAAAPAAASSEKSAKKKRSTVSAPKKSSAAPPDAKQRRQANARQRVESGDGDLDDMADLIENTVLG